MITFKEPKVYDRKVGTLDLCNRYFNEGVGILLPSASTSLTMSWRSASVGFWPRDLITVPSSLLLIVPSPSLSNKLNASLNSMNRQTEIDF